MVMALSSTKKRNTSLIWSMPAPVSTVIVQPGTTLGIDVVELGDGVEIGLDPGLAQVAELVERAQRVDPASEGLGARRERDPVDVPGRGTSALRPGVRPAPRGTSGAEAGPGFDGFFRGARGFFAGSGPSAFAPLRPAEAGGGGCPAPAGEWPAPAGAAGGGGTGVAGAGGGPDAAGEVAGPVGDAGGPPPGPAPRSRSLSRRVSSLDAGIGDRAASDSTIAARWSRASSKVVIMSVSTASKPERIRSRTASMPWVNSASFPSPTIAAAPLRLWAARNVASRWPRSPWRRSRSISPSSRPIRSSRASS